MKLELSKLGKQIAIMFHAKVNCIIVSPPGIGKTDTINATAARLREKVEDFRIWYMDVPTMSPTDIGATMPNRETGLLEFFCNAGFPNAYTAPDARGILNLGEILNTDPTTLKLLQKYCNGEDINGKLRKPDGVIVVGDSNRISDKAGVFQQSRAFMNRFIHIEVFSTPDQNIKYAEENEFHAKVVDFMKKFPYLIDNYEEVFEGAKSRGPNELKQHQKDQQSEEAKRGIWACMRGWKRISNLEYTCDELKQELMPQLVNGSVGMAIGSQYMTHRTMFDKLLTVEEIVRHPEKAEVSDNASILYVQLAMLAATVDAKHMPQVSKYLARCPGDMKVMCIRRMLIRMRRDPSFKVTSTKEYRDWMSDQALSDLIMARS
jgi:hypothetical protein